MIKLIGFGKYKNQSWEDVIYKDRAYVSWLISNYSDGEVIKTAKYWLETIPIDAKPLIKPTDNQTIVLTQNSQKLIVSLLGKDGAKQLALNILNLIE